MIALLIGGPFGAAECGGVDVATYTFHVSGKHFNSGRNSCYEITLKSSDNGESRYCAQPEEYQAIRIGDSILVKAQRGRITGHFYVDGIGNVGATR